MEEAIGSTMGYHTKDVTASAYQIRALFLCWNRIIRRLNRVIMSAKSLEQNLLGAVLFELEKVGACVPETFIFVLKGAHTTHGHMPHR